MKKPRMNGRTLEPYLAYNFIDKDPVIDQLRTLIETETGHRLVRKDLRMVQDHGGPKIGTMEGWFFKKTKRPQSAGVESAGRAVGYYRPWTKMPPAMLQAARDGTKLKGAKAIRKR